MMQVGSSEGDFLTSWVQGKDTTVKGEVDGILEAFFSDSLGEVGSAVFHRHVNEVTSSLVAVLLHVVLV